MYIFQKIPGIERSKKFFIFGFQKYLSTGGGGGGGALPER